MFGISMFLSPNAKALGSLNFTKNKAAGFFVSIFAWIYPSIVFPDGALLLTHGPDALALVLFLRINIFILAVIAVPSLFIILPLNYSGNQYQTSQQITTIGRLSMSNIEADSPKLTAHALFTWVYSIIIYGTMWWYLRTYAIWRQRYLNRPIPSNYTVMFQFVPVELRDKQAFTNWVKSKYPFEIVRQLMTL